MAKLPDNKKLKFIQNHPLYRSSYQKLKEFEKARIFCCHQMDHLLDVARIAYILNLEMNLGLDRELIYGAALLHDIGRLRQYKDGTPHEVESARLAKDILKDCDYSKEEIWLMTEAIVSHRLIEAEKEKNLKGFLYKADKLSRNCVFCPAKKNCNWEKDKKNKYLLY